MLLAFGALAIGGVALNAAITMAGRRRRRRRSLGGADGFLASLVIGKAGGVQGASRTVALGKNSSRV